MARESAKKRAREQPRNDAAPQPSGRYHPGVDFTEMTGSSAVDLKGIKDGSKELWLLQLPKPLTLQHLHGVAMELESAHVPGTSGASLGTFSSKEGIKFEVVQEAGHISQQLFVVASGSGEGSGGALTMLPLSKRVTFDRVEEGPLPLPTVQPAPEAIEEELPAPEPLTAAERQKRAEAPSTSTKEKKDKKKDRGKKKQEEQAQGHAAEGSTPDDVEERKKKKKRKEEQQLTGAADERHCLTEGKKDKKKSKKKHKEHDSD